MENNVVVFTNPEFGKVSAVVVDGREYFAATECAKMLGYTKPERAIKANCNSVVTVDSPTKGGVQKVKFISEGDLYRLIVRSKSPDAEKFEQWICDRVVPAIRKTGVYAVPKSIEELALEVIGGLQARIREMKPKADYFDNLVDERCYSNFRDTAKQLGIKEGCLVALLLADKFVYRNKRGQLKPYAQYTLSEENPKGYFTIKDYKSKESGFTGQQTLVTPYGKEAFRLFYI